MCEPPVVKTVSYLAKHCQTKALDECGKVIILPWYALLGVFPMMVVALVTEHPKTKENKMLDKCEGRIKT